jgi:hypothetical protein
LGRFCYDKEMDETLPTFSLLEWDVIDDSMDTFVPAHSGFTLAQRGFVTLPDERVVFVKIGTDATTKKWIAKEIDAYLFLQSNGYEQIPKLLSIGKENTAFALEYLGASKGWEWDSAWTESRLDKTFEAMASLAQLGTTELPDSFTTIRMMKEIKNSWQIFKDDSIARDKLISKLNICNRQDISNTIFKSDFLTQDLNFNFLQDDLTHYDIRSDNCAWNRKTQEVKLIDWNWIQLGNRDIDANALLVSVVESGSTLSSDMASRLNKNALIWLAGSWFGACIGSVESNMSEDSSLRDYQLRSAIVAYELALTV